MLTDDDGHWPRATFTTPDVFTDARGRVQGYVHARGEQPRPDEGTPEKEMARAVDFTIVDTAYKRFKFPGTIVADVAPGGRSRVGIVIPVTCPTKDRVFAEVARIDGWDMQPSWFASQEWRLALVWDALVATGVTTDPAWAGKGRDFLPLRAAATWATVGGPPRRVSDSVDERMGRLINAMVRPGGPLHHLAHIDPVARARKAAKELGLDPDTCQAYARRAEVLADTRPLPMPDRAALESLRRRMIQCGLPESVVAERFDLRVM